MTDLTDIIHENLDKAFEKVEKDWKERIEPFIEKVKMSIKHPHFYYAVVDTKNMTYEFKRKKWYKWFSGKRIVYVKIQPIEMPDIPDYKPMKKENGYGRF